MTVFLEVDYSGYFEFRLWADKLEAGEMVTQECFDRHLLILAEGSIRYRIPEEDRKNTTFQSNFPSKVKSTVRIASSNGATYESSVLWLPWRRHVRNGMRGRWILAGIAQLYRRHHRAAASDRNGQRILFFHTHIMKFLDLFFLLFRRYYSNYIYVELSWDGAAAERDTILACSPR